MRWINALTFMIVAVLPAAAVAASWGCYGTKPGHPTPAERLAFVHEAGELAVKAEIAHGVPASGLAAISIAESGYGWTRVALQANNFFAWKSGSAATDAGRKSYRASCPGRRNVQYVIFRNKADSFDYVAAKLATLNAYREHTEAYKAARKRGDPTGPAVAAWVAGIARRYSEKPAEFTRKITRLMNNPIEPADTPSPEHNLHQLSARASSKR